MPTGQVRAACVAPGTDETRRPELPDRSRYEQLQEDREVLTVDDQVVIGVDVAAAFTFTTDASAGEATDLRVDISGNGAEAVQENREVLRIHEPVVGVVRVAAQAGQW